MQESATINLVLNKGADFSQSFYLKNDTTPINLAGYSAKAALKRTHYDPASAIVFNTIIDSDPTIGKITISLAKEIIETIPPSYTLLKYQIPENYLQLNIDKLPSRVYVWDLILTEPSNVESRLIEGAVMITPGVTQ